MTVWCYNTESSIIRNSIQAEAYDSISRENHGHNDSSRKDSCKPSGSISLRSYSKLTRIADKLPETHKHTKRLTVLCPSCEPDWRSPKLEALFVSFGHLPHLERVTLNCVGLLDGAFPISLLTVILEACPNLQALELDDVALALSTNTVDTATNNDVEDLATVVQKLATTGQFREFRIFGCLADDVIIGGHSLDPLLASLAHLEWVEICAVDDGLLGTVTGATMQRIAQSTTLKLFHLHGFILNDHCLTQFASAMADNTVLQDLSLDLLAKSLGSGAVTLAHSLHMNQHLQKLHLTLIHTWNDDRFFQALATALSTECTLKTLIIGTCAAISDETAHCFVEMMKHNHNMQALQLSRYKGTWKPHLEYYLKLNEQGRGYFHSNFTALPKNVWVEDGLIPVRDDIDAIYYILHMNPVLLCSAA